MSAASLNAKLLPILLLIISNLFMTFAWYGHLRFKQVPLMTVILTSHGFPILPQGAANPSSSGKVLSS